MFEREQVYLELENTQGRFILLGYFGNDCELMGRFNTVGDLKLLMAETKIDYDKFKILDTQYNFNLDYSGDCSEYWTDDFVGNLNNCLESALSTESE